MARKTSKRKMVHTWQESFSLGSGLLFISILAFTSQFFSVGTFLFVIGIYFLVQGSRLKKQKKGTLSEWASYKVLQSIVMVALGLVLMNALPARFFGPSLIVTFIGFMMFLYVKLSYNSRK